MSRRAFLISLAAACGLVLCGTLLLMHKFRTALVAASPPAAPARAPAPEEPISVAPSKPMKPLEPPRIRRRTLDVPPEPATPMPETPPVPQDLPPVPDNVRRSATAVFPVAEGDRVTAARKRVGATVRDLFSVAEVAYPAEVVFLRAFKRERELELWAGKKSGPLKLVATYGVAAASGKAGPKRRQGDSQVPEGFYEVDRFNPESSFHLSLGINYPNAADRILSDPQKPGYNIFIHGNAASIGCLAMGDDRIEEIFLAAFDAKAKPVRVHIFPARMNASDWLAWRDEQIAARAELAAPWEQLQRGFEAFEKDRRVPEIGVRDSGEYFIRATR